MITSLLQKARRRRIEAQAVLKGRPGSRSSNVISLETMRLRRDEALAWQFKSRRTSAAETREAFAFAA